MILQKLGCYVKKRKKNIMYFVKLLLCLLDSCLAERFVLRWIANTQEIFSTSSTS